MRRPEIVKQIKSVINEAAPTAMAILFGSEARGGMPGKIVTSMFWYCWARII